MNLASIAWYAVPSSLALPAFFALTRLPAPAEGLVCLVLGLLVVMMRAGEQLAGKLPPVGQVMARWGIAGWVGAVLSAGPAAGSPIWLGAVGWTLAWSAWLRASGLAGGRVLWPMLAVPLVSFPWILHELPELGWSFRWSAAAVTRWLFDAAGLAVDGHGTSLSVQGVDVAVDAACAGLGALQAMLLAGTIWLTGGSLPPSRWLPGVLLLVPLAWLANTARVLALSVTALSFGTGVASGPWHGPIGWIVLMFVYAAAVGLATRCLAPTFPVHVRAP